MRKSPYNLRVRNRTSQTASVPEPTCRKKSQPSGRFSDNFREVREMKKYNEKVKQILNVPKEFELKPSPPVKESIYNMGAQAVDVFISITSFSAACVFFSWLAPTFGASFFPALQKDPTRGFYRVRQGILNQITFAVVGASYCFKELSRLLFETKANPKQERLDRINDNTKVLEENLNVLRAKYEILAKD